MPLEQVPALENCKKSRGAAVSPGPQQLTSLDDLPNEVWEPTPEPPMGYFFSSRCEAPGRDLELLLDGGAVLGLVMEETVVRAVNAAIAQGGTPESED